MAQFDVFENINPNTKQSYPYLLEVQSNILEQLKSTVVIPLISNEFSLKPISNLNYALTINDNQYLLMTQEISAISRKLLKNKIANLITDRKTILGALDFLITGF